MVKLKFKCNEVGQIADGVKITLSAVMSDLPEKEQSIKCYGQILIVSDKPKEVKEFVPGKEFYIDFTPVK